MAIIATGRGEGQRDHAIGPATAAKDQRRGFFHVSLLPYVRQRTKLDACTRRCQTGWNEGLVGTGRVRPIGGFSESQVRYAHAEDLRQPAAVEEAWHRVAGFPRLH